MHWPITQMNEQPFIYFSDSSLYPIVDILMTDNLCAKPIMVRQNSNLS